MATDYATRNAEIIRLRQSGLRPHQIRKRLGLSRGAVLGVLFRAGLTTPGAQFEMKAVGVDVGGSKLDDDKVREIRRLHQPGDPSLGTAALAKRFGVDKSTITSIVRRYTWRHVE